MWHRALKAADYAVTAWEARVDAAIGRPARRALERYVSLVLLGIPIAWVGAGLRWNGIAFAGLAVGVGLYAVLDASRRAVSAVRRRRSGGAPRRPSAP
jgi:hypothetical protein